VNAFAKALEEGQFNVSGVCTDCRAAKDGGDTSGNDPEWDVATFGEALAKYDVTPGHPHGNQWHTECPHWETPCPDDADCDCDWNPFSTSECGMCGTPLHGERHDYTFIERAIL
jgi:hypothetical protein